MKSKAESPTLNSLLISKLESLQYQIVKIPNKINTHGDTQFHYYAYKVSELVGQGNFGRVYKAYAVNTSTGELDLKKPFALKILKKANPSEFKIFGHYYKCEQPDTQKGEVYFVSEFFPGSDLCDDYDDLNPEFKNLTFGQTLELFQQLMMAINILHHDTPRTGAAISHADIKGQNIRVFIDPTSGITDPLTGKIDPNSMRIHVNILDFGLSDEIEDDPKCRLNQNVGKGTPVYTPLEAALGHRGLKSDIYALVPIVILLLGGICPFYNKDQYNQSTDQFYKARYDYTAIFSSFRDELNRFPFGIKKIVKQFLDRMQSDYEGRPDSDETLKFFITLNNTYKLCKQLKLIGLDETLVESLEACKITLMLLSRGLWVKGLYRCKLEENPELKEAIVKLDSVFNLTKETIEGLLRECQDEKIEVIDIKKLEEEQRKFMESLSDETEIEEFEVMSFNQSTSTALSPTTPANDKEKEKEKEVDKSEQAEKPSLLNTMFSFLYRKPVASSQQTTVTKEAAVPSLENQTL